MKNTEDRDELLLVIGEDGKVSLYEDPYATIEVKTEEDYIFLMDAVNKQTAEKPIVKHKVVNGAGVVESAKYRCNLCDCDSDIEKDLDKFCRNCGQKISWELDK